MRAKTGQKRSGWELVNSIVLVLHVVLPVWIFALMYTPGLTGALFLIALAGNLIFGVVHKLLKHKENLKPLLYVLRGAVICLTIAFYMPTALLLGFDRVKLLYPLKRLDYTRSVYGENSTYYERILPEQLPKVCEDYSFRTQGSMIAQDYHPTSWLCFTTDKETLDAYAVYYDGQGYARGAEERDLRWLAGQMHINVSDNEPVFEKAVVYYIRDYYPKAVVLDYGTMQFRVMT